MTPATPHPESLETRLERIEQMLGTLIAMKQSEPKPFVDDTVPVEQVMKMLGYTCRKSFWAAVPRLRIPHEKISGKKKRFSSSALNAWMKSRQHGARAA